MEPNVGNILIQATSAAFFAKILVDACKKSPIPTDKGWMVLLLAFLFAQLTSFLLFVYLGGTFNLQNSAGNVLAGVAAFGSAIGLTELQRSVDKEENK